MTNINHQPCPFCESSDAFGYNTETGAFYCFSCKAKPSNKGGLCFDGKNLERKEGHKVQEVSLIDKEPYIPEQGVRGISKKTLESDGLFFLVDDDKGPVATFVYPNGFKYRKLYLDKKDPYHFSSSGKLDRLMGIEKYSSGGKYITITEGEWDRYSVLEMMGNWPVANVPSATPSKAFWQNTKEDLKGFEKIILSVDNDEPGNRLAEKFYRIFPGKVYRVNHGQYKDANDFLVNGDQALYKKSWWNAQKIKPETVLCTKEDFLKLYEETPNFEFFETGLPGLDEKILGIHKGAFTLILAETGIGKTEFFRYLEYKALSDTNYSIAVCHGEETPLRGLLGLVSYKLQDNLTRKDLHEQKGKVKDVKRAIQEIADTERFYQFQIKVDDTVDDIVDQIRFLATGMGVDYVFLEPIQDFVFATNTTEKESLLTDLSNKLKRLAAELNIGILVIAHANADGDAKYCKSIVQSAAYEIRIERDLEGPDSNETKVYVGRKNRTGGGSGYAGSFLFDLETYTMSPKLTASVDFDVDSEVGF